MTTKIAKVDYCNADHAADFRMLLNAYATDPMGGGSPIDPVNLERLPNEMAKMETAFSLIAYVDDQPAALINCFFGFSTFAARKLINIHDVVVLAEFRGQGLSRKLFEEVERIGMEHDCCKLTLEVLDGNELAMKAYRNLGFANYALDDEHGKAEFWHKALATASHDSSA